MIKPLLFSGWLPHSSKYVKPWINLSFFLHVMRLPFYDQVHLGRSLLLDPFLNYAVSFATECRTLIRIFSITPPLKHIYPPHVSVLRLLCV